MNGSRLMLYCAINCLLRLALVVVPCSSSSSSSDNHVDESNQRNGSRLVAFANENSTDSTAKWYEAVDAVKVNYTNKQLIDRQSTDDAARSRQSNKPGRFQIFKRLGNFMAFIPVGLQLLQLPAAFASVKFQLIKSILVAKVALIMIFLRILFTPPRQTKIVVVKPPKEYHDHYYHHHPFEDPEDNKPGWLGTPPSWMT